jgi:hypothetical protein
VLIFFFSLLAATTTLAKLAAPVHARHHPNSHSHHSDGSYSEATNRLSDSDHSAADTRYLRSKLSLASIGSDGAEPSHQPRLRQKQSNGSLANCTTASSTRTSDSYPPFRSSLATSASGGSTDEPRHVYFPHDAKPPAPFPPPLITSHSLPLLPNANGLEEPPVTPGGSNVGLGITSDEPCYPSAAATISRSPSSSGSYYSENGTRWSLRGNYANIGMTNGPNNGALTAQANTARRKSFLDITGETTDEEYEDEEEELKDSQSKKTAKNGLSRAVVVAELGEGRIIKGRGDGGGVTRSEVPSGTSRSQCDPFA